MMVSAVTGEPSQGPDQFRSQFYTAGIDLKTALKNLALAADNVKKAAGGLGVEDIAAFIFYFFKTAATTLFAAAVPLVVIGSEVNHLLFSTLLSLGS
jgi:hypothetical protein